MAGNYLSNPNPQFLDLNGDPVSGGAVEFFEAGSTTSDQDTFTDKDLTPGNENPNPIVLDSDGRSPTSIFLQQLSYNVRLLDAPGGNVIWARDNVSNILQVDLTGLATIATYAAARLIAGATMTDGDRFFIETRATDGDQAFGTFYWDAASVVTDDDGTILKLTDTVTGRLVRDYSGAVLSQWFGDVGDGANDDKTAIENALTAAITAGVPLEIVNTGNDHLIGSVIVIASLANPMIIKGIGKPTLKYTGANTAFFLTVSATNGLDVTVENILVDLDQKASVGWRVDNDSADMTDANIGTARFTNAETINGFMNTGITAGTAAAEVVGGFDLVHLKGCVARDFSRATGAGIIGSQGTAGFVVANDSASMNKFPRQFIMEDCIVENITNNETLGTADDVDTDGVIYTTPPTSANGDESYAATCIVKNNQFINCKGRFVKTATPGLTIVDNNEFTLNLEESTNSHRDVDIQRGPGRVENNHYVFELTATSGTVWGTSHQVVAWSPDNAVGADGGGLIVRGNQIDTDIPSGTDILPFFSTILNGTSASDLRGVTFEDNIMVGGRVARFVKISWGTGTPVMNINRNVAGINAALIETADGGALTRKLNIFDNVNLAAVAVDLVEASGGGTPFVNGSGNVGFTRVPRDVVTSGGIGETFRPEKIGNPDAINGGVMSIERLSLADDASGVLTNSGLVGGVCIMSSDRGDTRQTIFSFDTGDTQTDLGGAADVSFGNGANPDVDTDINIWQVSGVINVKNRSGSTAALNFLIFTGD